MNDIRQIENKIQKNTYAALLAAQALPALHYSFLRQHLEGQKKDEELFSLWSEDAPAVKELSDYISAITKEGGEDYIEPVERIAVFDLDGTLFCETDPTYFDYRLLYYRVRKDPDYKDKASDFEKEVADKIEDVIKNGTASTGLDVENGQAISSAFAGFSMDEFHDYVHKVRERPADGYDGMTIGEAFYKPMLQLIKYLKENTFRVFICSGTDRMVVRGIVDGEVDVMPSQVLGTDEVLMAKDQGGTDGIDYVFDNNDDLVLGGKLLVKNLKMNKVALIAREIGQQPVLCFGNSEGDSSMANYVTSKNKHRTGVFMVCCDDLVRENGNLKKAQKMYDLCQENGWTPISMKNDWLTIYGEGVTKKDRRIVHGVGAEK